MFLRASIRRISKAQNFEDEVKRLTAMIQTLHARNQELQAQLVVERQEKTSK
jgi:hypothetical protein